MSAGVRQNGRIIEMVRNCCKVVLCGYCVVPFCDIHLTRLRLFDFFIFSRFFEISFVAIKICNTEPSLAKPRYKKKVRKISEISRDFLR